MNFWGMMWFPHLSAVTALCLLTDMLDAGILEEALEKKFRERSQSDWEGAWHGERHNRCHEDLTRHMFWACEKDIYRLVRRNANAAQSGEELQEAERYETNLQYPWLRAIHARRFVRWRRSVGGRRKRSSITAECCAARGCTWEEYAEYCPFKRQVHKTTDWT